MQYIGEHLLPGKMGNFFLYLSFVSSFLATCAFYAAQNNPTTQQKKIWLRIARIAFLLETVAVIAIFFILYYLISQHYFEYRYVWQHSDRALKFEYLLSCFWEGQEGSFLLWSFWHCVLGWLLVWRAGKWEAGVMTVVSFAQLCLSTMILGLYIGSIKIGTNPFVLLRNEMEAPIFSNPNYLTMLKDGNGLNDLLQNYWMVIHPPVLFLGFAACIVPFAYAIAGLKQKNNEWLKPSQPWTLFAVATLGLGIMMGAMWAYESLSFGGYWAWDPVENASLVPWLVLVSGLHTQLIYQRSGYSLRSTYFFYLLSYILIVYSTFLTRSGILGDTSVHAFTALGMNLQLLLFVLVFLLPSAFLFAKRYAAIPTLQQEESSYSRAFWMFIGSLILFLSGTIMLFITSLPVFNKIVAHFEFLQNIFKNSFSQPEDVEFVHNQIQIFVAILLGVLTGFVQYLNYKPTTPSIFFKKIWLPTAVALVLSMAIFLFGHINYDKQGIGFLVAIYIALFSAVFAVVANIGYIWIALKGKLKTAGGSVAHIGFGLMLLGILISSSKKTILSWNTTGISPLKATEKEKPAENATLFMGVPTDMRNYTVSFKNINEIPIERKKYFDIYFQPKDSSEAPFWLYPHVMKNKGGQQFSANPDVKHYWNKDVFVYITSFNAAEKSDTSSFRNEPIKIGDTVFYNNGFMVLNNVLINPENKKQFFENGATAMFLELFVSSKEGRNYIAHPGVVIKGTQIKNLPDSVNAESIIVKFNKVIDQKTGILEIGIQENKELSNFITLKVVAFPFINVLWLGLGVMMAGFGMSIVQRMKANSGRKE